MTDLSRIGFHLLLRDLHTVFMYTRSLILSTLFLEQIYQGRYKTGLKL